MHPPRFRVVGSKLATTSLALALIAPACAVEPAADLSCDDGQCDTAPSLTAIPLDDLVVCELSPETGSVLEPQFQHDRVICSARPLPANDAVAIEVVWIGVNDRTGQRLDIAANGLLDKSELTGKPVEIATVRGDGYPIEISVTVDYAQEHTSVFHARRVKLAARPKAAANVIRYGAPFALWQVALWPDQSLVDAWGKDVSLLFTRAMYRFPIASDALGVAGTTASTEIAGETVGFHRIVDLPSLAALRGRVFHVLAPAAGAAAGTSPSEFRIGPTESGVRSPLSGPGYYVVGRDFRATPTAPQDLPGDAPVAPGGDAGGPGGADAAPPPPVDPCQGSCTASQVCVSTSCVERARQTQSSQCDAPERACDVGQDADCADGHVCVGGKCLRLTCQSQSSTCS
jgi:hypothetical protein